MLCCGYQLFLTKINSNLYFSGYLLVHNDGCKYMVQSFTHHIHFDFALPLEIDN